MISVYNIHRSPAGAATLSQRASGFAALHFNSPALAPPARAPAAGPLLPLFRLRAPQQPSNRPPFPPTRLDASHPRAPRLQCGTAPTTSCPSASRWMAPCPTSRTQTTSTSPSGGEGGWGAGVPCACVWQDEAQGRRKLGGRQALAVGRESGLAPLRCPALPCARGSSATPPHPLHAPACPCAAAGRASAWATSLR